MRNGVLVFIPGVQQETFLSTPLFSRRHRCSRRSVWTEGLVNELVGTLNVWLSINTKKTNCPTWFPSRPPLITMSWVWVQHCFSRVELSTEGCFKSLRQTTNISVTSDMYVHTHNHIKQAIYMWHTYTHIYINTHTHYVCVWERVSTCACLHTHTCVYTYMHKDTRTSA